MTKLASALFIALSGCATDAVEPTLPTEDPTDPGSSDPGDPAMVPLVADMCDEPTFAGASWAQKTSAHFTLNYLPGSVVADHRTAISDRLERAYANIRGALGVTAEPELVVNLSPSRNAAVEHNLGFGRAWPEAHRYDVIYTGAHDSYEMRRYGQLLTAMLDYHIDPNNRHRIPVLATGVGELLDQSGRDLHVAYARQLAAGLESRVHLAELDSLDVIGQNTGRAGSLVKFMVDRYGMETFLDIYKATAITWHSSYGCNWHAGYGCISNPDQLTSMLDGVLMATVGENWSDIQPAWAATVESAFESMPIGMATRPTSEIENVLRVMDHAITTNNAFEYRTTMEGFYCNGRDDAERDEIAARAVWAYRDTRTQLLGLYDTGIKNFSTAQALVMRTDDTGIPTFQTISFEQMPDGWRVSYSPDWY